MLSQSGSIFLGVTTSPTREFVAKAIKDRNPDKILMPCAGRFGVIEAMIGVGVPKSKIYASDIGLFSTIIGYLADPVDGRSLASLGIRLPDTIPVQPSTGEPDFDLAAQTMLVLGLNQISAKHQKGQFERAEILANWPLFHSKMVVQLKAMIDNLRGIHYDIMDMWDVIAQATDRDAIFCNIPTYKGGYEKMFQGVAWNEPTYAQLDYSMFQTVVDRIRETGAMAMVGSHLEVHYRPDGWHTVLAHQVTANVTDYLIASFDPGTSVAAQKMGKGPTQRFPVYCDEEITPESKITMVEVDAPTGLYYRDLFVHKLGTTPGAYNYYLMLIDGRVVTAFGSHASDLRRFGSEHLFIVFTITKSSARYRRLVKLFELFLTSGDMRRFLLATNTYGVREPRGVLTTMITNAPQSMISRGIMKFHSREKLKGGRYKVKYQADFRADTFQDCLARWLERWGHVHG